MVEMSLPFSQDERDLAAGGILTIDLAALRHNYSAIATRIAPTRTAAVVKADAYGLGASRVAPAFYEAGCRDFFVAHLGEAVALKPFLKPDATLYVLNGLQPGTEAACAREGILPVLNSLEQVENWAALATRLGKKLPALLQFDTGMSRLGLSAKEFDRLLENVTLLSRIDIKFAISHLANGDEPGNAANARQLAKMTALLARLPKLPAAWPIPAAPSSARPIISISPAPASRYMASIRRGSMTFRIRWRTRIRNPSIRSFPSSPFRRVSFRCATSTRERQLAMAAPMSPTARCGLRRLRSAMLTACSVP
ncbi:conserved hypothetical protein [Brucella sp. NVSL 07-0026]|nr:conserved hypothetical protein [Brucella sp. NVSL 07-0026]